MTNNAAAFDAEGIRELQARRIRMARAAADMTADALADAVKAYGVPLSRDRVRKLEAGIGEEAGPTLLAAIAYVVWDDLTKEVVNPVEWLKGSPPILPGPTRVNPGSLKRRWNTPVDRPKVPVLTLVKQVA